MGNYKQPVGKSTGYTQSPEEYQWIRMVREEGDRKAFEQIFRTYYKRLHGFAYSYVKRKEDAEDVVQTVLLRIWAQREDWNPPGTLKQYLFAAVRNEALNFLRHQQIMDEAEEEVIHLFRQLKDPAYSENNSKSRELQQAIQKGIDQLPSRCREIFLLSRRSGLTYAEIADVLDVSVNTVGTQMGRALKSLREHLSGYLYLFAVTGLPTAIYQAIFYLLLFFLTTN
mgnify:CR=1 FL=1